MEIPSREIGKNKRCSYSLQVKVDVIKRIQNGESHGKISTDTKIPRPTISNIWKKKDTILNKFKCSNPKLKKSRAPQYRDLDEALHAWFSQHRTSGLPLDGTILKAQALVIAAAIGLENFTASSGWFEGWKSRYDVTFSRINGESASAPAEDVTQWLNHKWPVIRAGYQPTDIYNADETALFFKMLPDKTYRSKADKSNGKKISKERVTALFCANMNGSHKLKPLIIGKAAKPRKFPKDFKKLPVFYKNNKKAWMTGLIWEWWLRQWDEDLAKQKRKILLLVDNCSAHVQVPFLKNICVEFFPPNVTSLLQPMDQGIIKNAKLYYRRFLMEKLLAQLEFKGELLNTNLYDATILLDHAWKSVTSSTIENCFGHAKLLSEEQEIFELENTVETETDALLTEIFSQLELEKGPEDSINGYVSMDAEEPICAVLSQDDIIENIRTAREVPPEPAPEDEDEDEIQILESEGVQPPFNLDIFEHLSVLRSWAVENNLPEHVLALASISSVEMAAFEEKVSKRIQ